MEEGKYLSINVKNPPQYISAYQVYEQLKSSFDSRGIRLKICSIRFKYNNQVHSNFKDQWYKYFMNDCYWWNPKIMKCIEKLYSEGNNEDDAEEMCIINQFSIDLQNEFPFFLGRYHDYNQLVENLIIRPNEELCGIPSSDIPQSLDLKKINKDQKEKTLKIWFWGKNSDFIDLEEKKNLIHLEGNKFQFEKAMKLDLLQKFPRKSIVIECQGKDIMFGKVNGVLQKKDKKEKGKNIKFLRFWGLQSIKNRFQEQIQIDNITMNLIDDEINVYFDILIAQIRRIHFRINFQIQRPKNKIAFEEKDGNRHYNEGIAIIEKGENQLNFYFRFSRYPKCYLYEKQDVDAYEEPLQRNWFRCQNFLFNKNISTEKRIDLFEQCWLRFAIEKQQCENEDFLVFCRYLEDNCLIRLYSPKQFIGLTNMDNILQYNEDQMLNHHISWSINSFISGRQRILVPYTDKQKIAEELRSLTPERVLEAVRTQFKKQQEKVTQNCFISIIKSFKSSKQKKFEGIKKMNFTISLLQPDGYIAKPGIFLLQNKLLMCQIKKKEEKFIDLNLKDHLLYVVFGDDKQKKFDFSFFTVPNNFQNKLVWCSYFKEQMKNPDFKMLEQNYEFLGFNYQSLKNQACYYVERRYAKTILNRIYQKDAQLGEQYPKAQNLLSLMNEFFRMSDLYISEQEIIEEIKEQYKGDDMMPQIDKLIDIDCFQLQNQNMGYKDKIFLEQGSISKCLVDIISKIIFPEDCDISTLLIQYKQYKGIVNVNLKNELYQIKLNRQMEIANSPYLSQPQIFHKNNDLIFQLSEDIQIISISEFRPCKLNLNHILNLMLFQQNVLNQSIQKYIQIATHCFFQVVKEYKDVDKLQQEEEEKETRKPDQQEDLIQYYQQFIQSPDGKENLLITKKLLNNQINDPLMNFKLPIEEAGYLIGVQDPCLNQDEVFIQISQMNQLSNSKIINTNNVLIFKKYDIFQNGMIKFKNIGMDDARAQQLAKTYLQASSIINYYIRNVIVFSDKFDGSLFPYTNNKETQKFMVIWEENLIPFHFLQDYWNHDEIYQDQCADDKDHLTSLNDSATRSLQQTQSILSLDHADAWTRQSQNTLQDYFCFYQGTQNLQEIRLLHIALCQFLLTQNLNEQLNVDSFSVADQQSFMNSLKYAHLRYLWFGDTGAKFFFFGHDQRQLFQHIFKQLLKKLSFKECLRLCFNLTIDQ